MSRTEILGFDRKIELAWLDAAAATAARGTPISAARAQLFSMLEGAVAGDTPQSGRGKTLTVLSRIWLTPANTALGQRALQAIRQADSPEERLAIHWAMCTATHPFFFDVVTTTGRLLKLQGEVSQAQVTKRVAETWGDRVTLHRAVPRICRSLIEWGVLQETSHPGVYNQGHPEHEVRGGVAHLLIEGLLIGGAISAAPVYDLLRHPSLFPFALNISIIKMTESSAFDIERHGIDTDMISLSSKRPFGVAA